MDSDLKKHLQDIQDSTDSSTTNFIIEAIFQQEKEIENIKKNNS